MPALRRAAVVTFAQHRQKYRAPPEYMARFRHISAEEKGIRWIAPVAGVFIHAWHLGPSSSGLTVAHGSHAGHDEAG
jgi:hypothetical protein